jgi:hypothetical protein
LLGELCALFNNSRSALMEQINLDYQKLIG